MKGRVFGLIVLSAIVIGILSYFGVLGSANTVQVKAQYVEYDCGDANLDMRVVAVSDTAFGHLIGKTISPELAMRNGRLKKIVEAKLKSERGQLQSLNEFVLIGFVRQGPGEHCSGSLCFKVQKIKYEGEAEFTEF
jgi:hypothetical protein